MQVSSTDQSKRSVVMAVSVLIEVVCGLWLAGFAAIGYGGGLMAGASPTLLSLFTPIGATGVVLIGAATCTVFNHWKTAMTLLGSLSVLCTFRWLWNVRFVFPFGESTPNSTAAWTIQIWQSQQFAFAVVAVVLLGITWMQWQILGPELWGQIPS